MNKYTFIVLIITALFYGCNDSTGPSNDDAFGIYLLRDSTLTTSDAKILPIKSLNVQEKPIISTTDIIEYHWADHIIILTTEAFERSKSIEGKIKSTYGLPFLVLVGEQKIYLGNIYPAYSSYIHIDLPYIRVAPFIEMRIAKAPSQDVEDKRNDDNIYSALQRYNKIVR